LKKKLYKIQITLRFAPLLIDPFTYIKGS
jgi:hypothetical protein